MKQKRKTTYCC